MDRKSDLQVEPLNGGLALPEPGIAQRHNNSNGEQPARLEIPNPFDPANLRLSPQKLYGAGVKKLLTNVPTQKPDKYTFVRVRPGDDNRLETNVIDLKQDREMYLVHPDLWPELAAEKAFGPRALVTTITRQGAVFLWPLRLPGPDGRTDSWSRSAVIAAELATNRWVRIQSNTVLGAYEVVEAQADLAEPDWPSESFSDLLKIAFRDRKIDSLDHPVLRRLRGEV